MKLIQIEYKDEVSFKEELKRIRENYAAVSKAIFFQVYTNSVDLAQINTVCNSIASVLPNADYVGCSANGSIYEGRLSSSEIVVTCTIFENPTTKLEIVQYNLTDESAGGVANALVRLIESNPWIKGVALLATIRGMSMSNFSDLLYSARASVHIFGGGAFNVDLNSDSACVFSKVGGISEHAVVLVLLGGDDFYIETTHISGWKPLGREFKVTRASGSLLQELDNKPAFGIYHRYLAIQNDKRFFNNTLEFPFFYKKNGIDILRAPVSCTADGSLVMTSDIEESVVARMAYGDPETILNSVYRDCQKLAEFSPQVIQVFSCAGRRTFWGDSEISDETLPFQSIAPTAGFYTSGEFLRTGGFVNQHNVTLVVAAMREGAPCKSAADFNMGQYALSGRVSMISRLANFIEAATAELASANVSVASLANNDALTKFLNRIEIQKKVQQEVENTQLSRTPLSVLQFGIDNFREVNESFGTIAGDEVLTIVSDTIRKIVREYAPLAIVGRFSGDEFMLVLPGYNEIKALALAENIRGTMSRVNVGTAGKITVSVGITECKPRQTAEMVYARVSKALGNAKQCGKNRVVML